ncbi:hypothetical protein COV81_00340 [Candidatus Peregrinibacteria bacterium CG11_big_fil_rev_8_21_14_0_20_41_10]|nr:MAG: hypothetical protein COV81_00340 [Candidatus Peregrinibacteria bacterium CG11_big_fil_rev_8_21_14_0_20_41_10]PIZ73508.1 MAG: hypothetical protein COY06_05280 [Candidatus Peregrinibacteria bacterium CG_4_10_14_0_2_um_filter_41_8]
MKLQRSFKQLVIFHLFVLSATSIVFFWVIPLLNWLIPIPFAVVFYILYIREKRQGGATPAAVKYGRY